MKLLFRATLTAALAVTAFPAGAICWIARVSQVGDEVAIYFESEVEVVVGTADRPRQWRRLRIAPDDKNRGQAREPLLLKESYVAEIRAGGFHSACSAVVERENGRLGLSVEASDHLPGLQPQVVRQFISGN